MTDDQQCTWESERVRRNLARGHEGFANTGFMRFLDQPSLLVAAIPAGPLDPFLDFEEGLLHAVPQSFRGRTSNGVGYLGATVVTDDAIARVAHGDQTFRAYAAVSRSGAVEVGMGTVTRFGFGTEEAPRVAFRLYCIIHAIRVVIESQARLTSTVSRPGDPLGPFELVVALPNTADAVLGGLAEGWEEPTHTVWDTPACATGDVLVRTQFATWPTSVEEQNSTIARVGDRVCNAFGSLQRLFAPAKGPEAGSLSAKYA